MRLERRSIKSWAILVLSINRERHCWVDTQGSSRLAPCIGGWYRKLAATVPDVDYLIRMFSHRRLASLIEKANSKKYSECHKALW